MSLVAFESKIKDPENFLAAMAQAFSILFLQKVRVSKFDIPTLHISKFLEFLPSKGHISKYEVSIKTFF